MVLNSDMRLALSLRKQVNLIALNKFRHPKTLGTKERLVGLAIEEKIKERKMKTHLKTAALAFVISAPLMLGGCATAEEAIAEAFSDTQRASLTGAQVVSSSGDSDGYAQAEVSIANTLDQICYDINNAGNLAEITSVSINRGQRGQIGPMVLRFSQANEGGWKNCVKRSEWLEDALEWSPGNYYVQVSTTEFPSGAIRGQLTR